MVSSVNCGVKRGISCHLVSKPKPSVSAQFSGEIEAMRGSDPSGERLILSSPPESGGRSGGRSWILLVVLLALTLIAGALAYYLLQQKPGPRLTLAPARYNDLIGWQDDAVATAIPAFLKSCGALSPRAETAPLDARTKSGDFGSAADWRPLCAAAEQLPA